MATVNGRDFPERDDENLLHDLEKQSSGVCTTLVIFSYPWTTAVKKYDLNTDMTNHYVVSYTLPLFRGH